MAQHDGLSDWPVQLFPWLQQPVSTLDWVLTRTRERLTREPPRAAKGGGPREGAPRQHPPADGQTGFVKKALVSEIGIKRVLPRVAPKSGQASEDKLPV